MAYSNYSFGPTRSPRVVTQDFSGTRSTMNREYGRYELDHLATFSNINRRMRIPEDVISQLRQMETTGQMFSMRIILVITEQALIVTHAQSGDVIEQFPMRCVINPYAHVGRQNLVMFTCNIGDANEIHVFASAMTSANEVTDRIRAAKLDWTQVGRDEFEDGAVPVPVAVSNDGFGDFFSQPIKGPTAAPAYPQRYTTLLQNRAMNDSLTEQAHQFRMMRDLQFRNEQNAPPTGYQPYSPGQTVRTPNANEWHFQVLNWCFDDLEKFVNQLHRAMQAFRELDRRVTARKQRVYMPGDGMLIRMARLPNDNELYEVMQKFKFTFCLLARMQSVLFKPNSADIVHRLIPFLRTVVDASDATGQQPLAPTVVSPLMTSEVITLLKHCLTSQETEFWRSLGDAWCTAREHWKSSSEPYAPRFNNGYKLTAHEVEELIYPPTTANGHGHVHTNGSSLSASAAVTAAAAPTAYRLGALANQAAEEAQRRRVEEYDYSDGHYSPRSRAAPPSANSTQQLNITPPSATPAPGTAPARALQKLEELNQRYAAELRSRGARAYEVINEYTPTSGKEINVMRGEVVEVLNDERQWWKVRTATSQVGYCPCTVLRPLDALPPRDYEDSAGSRNARPASLVNGDGLLGTHAIPPPPPAPPVTNGNAIYGDPRRLGSQPTTKSKGYY